MTALNVPTLSTMLDGALGNSLAAIFDALLNHFMDKGLNAMSEGVRSVTGGENDNWSYDGGSYSGSTYGTSNTSNVPPLNIPQNVSVTVGETAITTISGGTAPYSIKTGGNPAIENTQISTSSSSGPKLIVTGVTPGQTFIIVKDSSNPEKAVTVQISVNAIGALIVNPHSILTDTSHPITATISGGIAPYTLQTSPNEAVAVTAFSGSNLVVIGVAPGQTVVVIKDSSVPAKTVVVPITIGGITNLAIPANIVAKIGETKSIAIAGGTAPYSILVQLPESTVTATVQISDNNFNVTGTTVGQTTVIIQDSSNPPKTATTSIQITVN